MEEGGNSTTTVYTHEIGVYEPNYNPGNRTGTYPKIRKEFKSWGLIRNSHYLETVLAKKLSLVLKVCGMYCIISTFKA